MQAMSGSIVDLGREDSLALLASAPVGRIVFTRGALPAIHPVNFVVDGDDVVITHERGLGVAVSRRRKHRRVRG